MADLVFTKEQWGHTVEPYDIIDAMVWEDEPDISSRWEEYHSGVFKWDGKFYWADWTEGKTEYQESRWFEDHVKSNGSISFSEAETYEVVETKWRLKK